VSDTKPDDTVPEGEGDELVEQTDNGPRPEDGEQPEDDLQEPGERTDLV
jgi:hypothetical protein